jgi:hypothetical protein
MDHLFADNEIAQALCEFSDSNIQIQSASDKAVDKAGQALLIDESFYAAACYGDQAAWQDTLDEFCQSRFAPLDKALQHGEISRLHIYPCDGHVFSVSRWQRYQFWKSVKPVKHFFQQTDSQAS